MWLQFILLITLQGPSYCQHSEFPPGNSFILTVFIFFYSFFHFSSCNWQVLLFSIYCRTLPNTWIPMFVFILLVLWARENFVNLYTCTWVEVEQLSLFIMLLFIIWASTSHVLFFINVLNRNLFAFGYNNVSPYEDWTHYISKAVFKITWKLLFKYFFFF